MKRLLQQTLIALFLISIPALVSAQGLKKLSQRTELVTVEVEVNEAFTTSLEVFRMKDDGSYWLSLGHLGIGSEVLQLQFDPVHELFIPLGKTLDEAIESLKGMQEYYNQPRLSTAEIQGCLTALYPLAEKLEPVTVTSRKMLAKKLLSFSVTRDDLVRSTYIGKSDFGSLVTSLKLYKKIHPKEK